MIKKYGSIINILLIVILSIISFKAVQIKNDKEKIDALYTGETAMYLSQTGLDYDQYNQAITKFNNIDGVTVSNTYASDLDRPQSILYIDSIYYNNYINDLPITGDKFNPDDFTIEFTKDTVIPIIINTRYANANGLAIGDETTVADLLPSVCSMFSDESTSITAADGTTVNNTVLSNKDMCPKDTTFDYLSGEDFLDHIPVKVIGTFENIGQSFPGFPINYYPSIDIIAPSYIKKDSNEYLYDLEKYRNDELTPVSRSMLLFVDYDKISYTELNEKIIEFEKDVGAELSIEKTSDWQKTEIEDKINMYNQALINSLFIGIVILVLWLLQMYYRLLAFQYESAVMTLIGAQRNNIIGFQFKSQMKISLTVLAFIIAIGVALHLLIYTLLYFLVLLILELIIFSVFTLNVKKENINQLLTGGNL